MKQRCQNQIASATVVALRCRVSDSRRKARAGPCVHSLHAEAADTDSNSNRMRTRILDVPNYRAECRPQHVAGATSQADSPYPSSITPKVYATAAICALTVLNSRALHKSRMATVAINNSAEMTPSSPVMESKRDISPGEGSKPKAGADVSLAST